MVPNSTGGRPRRIRRLRALARAGRERLRGGLQYWQAGGATRSAVKRQKRP